MLGMACNTSISCQHYLKNLPTGPWALESRGRNAQGYGMCRASEKSGWFQSIQPPGSHHSHSSDAAKPACQGHRPETSLLLAPLWLLARWGYGRGSFLEKWLVPVKIALPLTQCHRLIQFQVGIVWWKKFCIRICPTNTSEYKMMKNFPWVHCVLGQAIWKSRVLHIFLSDLLSLKFNWDFKASAF